MELNVYLDIFKRRAWIIALVTMSAVLIVTLIGLVITPEYTAKATVRVILDPGTANFTFREDYTQRLLSTYQEVLLSPPFLEKAISRVTNAPANLTQETLLKKITVELVSKTELMSISVVDRDPAFARDLANVMAQLLIEYPQELNKGKGKSTSQIIQEQLTEIETKLETDRRQVVDMQAQGKPISEIDAMQSQISFNETSYTKLLDNLVSARLNESVQANSISILAPATLPTQPSNNIGLNEIALGVVLGLLGGIALALVYENLDTRIYSARQVEFMTNLPVFGTVPHGLVPPGTYEQVDSSPTIQAIKEAYRVLIPNMKIFGKRDSSLRSILITSPTNADGKSLVAANLSQAIAEQGQQLFLVETDLRNPSLGKSFAIESDCGLSELLDSTAVLDQLVHPTQQTNLFLIDGGNKVANPTSLLSSPTMRRFLDYLDNRNQFIILDGPPVLGVADALVLAPYMNGVILVIGQEASTREQVFDALRQLQAARARLLGIIFVQKGHKGLGRPKFLKTRSVFQYEAK